MNPQPPVDEARAPEIAKALTQFLIQGNFTTQEACSGVGTVLARLFIVAAKSKEEAKYFVRNMKVEMTKAIDRNWDHERSQAENAKKRYAEQKRIEDAIAKQLPTKPNGSANGSSEEDTSS